VKLGVLHYRGRGRYAAGVVESRFRHFVAIFRVARIRCELGRVIASTAIRLMLPRRLLLLLLMRLRVWSVIIGGALRDVILVVMRIRDLVRRLRHAQIRDLTKASLVVGCIDKGSIVTS